MSQEAICVEFEADLAFQGKSLKSCSNCGMKTHLDSCLYCLDSAGKPLPLTGDSAIDSAIAKMEAGEDVDLNELLKGEKFVPVKPGDLNE